MIRTLTALSPKVLIIGLDPGKLDLNAPGLPPGVSAEALKAGIARVKAIFEAQGLRLDSCGLDPAGPIEPILEAQLAQGPYDCVVIGAGFRVPQHALLLFERVVNTVHRHAPNAAIAFNTSPADTWDAARRWRDMG